MKDVISPGFIINIPSCMLELYSGNTLIKEYPVAIDKSLALRPLSKFNIVNKEINPCLDFI